MSQTTELAALGFLNGAINKSTWGDIAVNVKVYGAKGDGVTDDTASCQSAIDIALEGSTIVFPAGYTFKLTNLVITKSLNIQMTGAKFIVDPTTSGANGNPFIWFKGSVGTAYALTTSADKSSTVTLSAAGTGANFTTGDYVIVQDTKVVVGYGGRTEVNSVKSVAGDVITLSKPIEWGYDTTPTLTKVTMIKQPKIYGALNIQEVDPGAAYTGTLTGNAPHIFHFQYCIEPEVKDCTFEKWNVHAVNFHLSINPKVSGCSATDPYRPLIGGNSYFMRFDRCLGGLASQNYTRGVRHTVDIVQSYGTHSEYNESVDCPVTSYSLHGHGAKRCSSSHDKSLGGSSGYGWGMGNSSFDADYDYTIINPKYFGTNSAIVASNNSDGLRVISPDIHTSYRGIECSAGAKNIQVTGGRIEIFGTSSGTSAVFASGCDSIFVDNVDIVDNNSAYVNLISIDSIGTIDISRNRIISSTSSTGIYIGATNPATNLNITNNKVTGISGQSVQVLAQPSKNYQVSNNLVDGYSTTGMSLIAAGNLRLFENYVTGSTAYTFSGSLTTAKTNGAVLFGNTPNSNDEIGYASFRALDINGAAGTNREIHVTSGGVLRWIIRVDNTAETGTEAGSDLYILCRKDDGTSNGVPLKITRKTFDVQADQGKFLIAGTYQKPLYMGTDRIWTNAGKLYIKSGSDPSTATDGVVVGTQT